MNMYCNCTNKVTYVNEARVWIYAEHLFNLPHSNIWLCWACFEDKSTFGCDISLEDDLGFTEAELRRPE